MRVAAMLRPEHIPLMTTSELLRFNSLALSDDLGLYMREAWPLVEPAAPFIEGWHIDAIAEHLEAVTAGQIRRLIVNVPPGFTKTLTTCVMWPTWEWSRNPSTRWIFTTHNKDLATKASIQRRSLMSSDWYRARWPGVIFSTDQNVKTEFENTAKGRMACFGFGSSPMGHHAIRAVIDDPIDPEKATSEVERESVINYWRLQLSTRLIPPDTAACVLIMQRLHELDLTGYLLAEEAGSWTHLCLPMEAPSRQTVVFLSGRKVEREAGELLCPERFSPEAVARLKLSLGSYGASGQLQQSPSPAEGGMLKRNWWKEWAAIPADLEETILSWDLSFKETTGSDFVVGQVWGKKGGAFYLLDQVRDRMDFPATCRAIESLSAKWPAAVAKLVEDKANGPAVISTLKTKISGLIAVEPRGSKEARASAVSPAIEAGNVFLPAPSLAPWVHDFIEECASFPKGANDDQVDAMTQALDRFLNRTDGIATFYARRADEIRSRAAEAAA
jgi:predicted phage terminase large subunit-like protein